MENEIAKRKYIHAWGGKSNNVWDFMSAVSQYSYLFSYYLIPQDFKNTQTMDDFTAKTEWGSDFVDRMYDAEPQAMSEELAAFNFRELCFNLDHFYGLREEHEIGNFAEMLVQHSALFSQMTSTDPAVFDGEGLAALYGGREEGVKTYTEKIGEELRDTMFMCGADTLADITPEMVRVSGSVFL